MLSRKDNNKFSIKWILLIAKDICLPTTGMYYSLAFRGTRPVVSYGSLEDFMYITNRYVPYSWKLIAHPNKNTWFFQKNLFLRKCLYSQITIFVCNTYKEWGHCFIDDVYLIYIENEYTIKRYFFFLPRLLKFHLSFKCLFIEGYNCQLCKFLHSILRPLLSWLSKQILKQ